MVATKVYCISKTGNSDNNMRGLENRTMRTLKQCIKFGQPPNFAKSDDLNTPEEGFEDNKETMRIRILTKNRQHNGPKLEDTKGAIRIRILKNRHHNGQKKKYKSVSF